MDEPLDVVGTGSMVVDEISRVPRLLAGDGKMLVRQSGDAPAIQRLVGGVTLNHLAWARVLGLRVGIFGKQADDEAGRFLRAGMDRLGMVRSIDTSGSVSSFARIYADDHGQRAIYMARGATAELTSDEIERLHRPLIARARFVTSEISQLPLPCVLRTFEIARECGARTVLDVDVPLREAVPGLGSADDLDAILTQTRVLKASRAALAGLTDANDPQEQAADLERRLGCDAVVITLGARGALVRAAGRTHQVAGASVQVRETTGAGDAFLGGMLSGLAADAGWPEALRLANAAGATCCEHPGGFPTEPFESLRDTVRRLAK